MLNAKQHEREAEIVAQAGRFGALTISTNMAGRGTDIVLGGNPGMILRSRGLDPDQAGRQAGEEEQQALAAQGAGDDHLAVSIDAVDLKVTLRDVEADCGRVHVGGSFCLGGFGTPIMAH